MSSNHHGPAAFELEDPELMGVDLGRRSVIVGGAKIAGAVGVGMTLDAFFPPEHHEEPHEEPHTAEGGDPHAAEGESKPEANHGTAEGDAANPEALAEQNGHKPITWLNASTTLLPGVPFGKGVVSNASEEGPHFGMKTLGPIASGEIKRLTILSTLGDENDQYYVGFESGEIVKNLGILYGILAPIAEATEHLNADEKAIFEGAKKLADKLDEENVNVMPDLEASNEAEWEAYIEKQNKKIVSNHAQNMGIGFGMAPLITTYTTAALTNALSPRMHQSLQEKYYAEAVLEMKQNGQPIPVDDTDLINESMSKAFEAMNDDDGYTNLMIAYFANLAGAAGIGDPPGPVMAINHGISELAEASKLGYGFAAAAGTAASLYWLKGKAGVGTLDAMSSVPKGVGATGQVMMSEAGTIKDLIVTAVEKAAGTINEGLGEMVGSLADRTNIRGETRVQEFDRIAEEIIARTDGEYNEDELRQMLGDIKTRKFRFSPSSFKESFAHYFKNNDDEAIEAIGDRLHNQLEHYDGNLDMVDDRTVEELTRFIDLAKNSHKGIYAALTQLAVRVSDDKGDEVAAKLAVAFGDVLKNGGEENVETAQNTETLIADAQVDLSDEQRADIADLQAEAAEVLKDAEDLEQTQRVLANFIKKIHATAGIPVKDTIIQGLTAMYTAQERAETGEEEKFRPGGLGESSKEVIAALTNQILAAEAIAIGVEKVLEVLDQAGVSQEAQEFAVRLFTAGLSATADNVVAYLTGEKVQLRLSQNEFGELSKEMQSAVIQTAWLIAIAAGGLYKLGNGPNFLIYRLAPVYDENNNITGHEWEEVEPNDTMKNYYSIFNTASAIALGTYRMGVAKDRERTKQQEAAAA